MKNCCLSSYLHHPLRVPPQRHAAILRARPVLGEEGDVASRKPSITCQRCAQATQNVWVKAKTKTTLDALPARVR